MSAKMSEATNALNWFEIPANNIGRAAKFYETIFEITMHQMEMMGMKMAMFPADSASGKAGGALVQSDMHKPATTGSIIYLNANPDLQLVLNRMEKAGGKIGMPKTLIDEQTGYMAFFTDTEGNYMGLHSNK
jgi:uncharacterized protein